MDGVENTCLVTMRPIAEKDYPDIYKMYKNDRLIHLWSPDTVYIDFEYFKRKICRRFKYRWDHSVAFEMKPLNEVSGFGYCYNINSSSHNACVCLFVNEPYIGKLPALHASYLYLQDLFENKNYLKLYSEVFEYNTRCIKLLRHLGFRQEGCLKAHQQWNGRYWDQYIFSISRDDFNNIKQKYRTILQRALNNESS
jgi:RimJ/RimL family protein N-acetyltransferase